MATSNASPVHDHSCGLSYGVVSRLLVNGQRRTLARGQVLIDALSVGAGCYWVHDGALKVSVRSNSGRERIVALAGPECLVGDLPMIDGLSDSVTVQALTDCKVTFIPRSRFLDRLRESPELQKYLSDTVVARLRKANEELAAGTFLTARGRVARALLQFAEHLGETTAQSGEIIIRRGVRQEDLAALAGVTRECTTRVLGEWAKRKIVVRRSRSTYVINTARLEAEAREACALIAPAQTVDATADAIRGRSSPASTPFLGVVNSTLPAAGHPDRPP